MQDLQASTLQRKRRHSCIHEDLDSARDRNIAQAVEWISLASVLAFWGYLMWVFLTAPADGILRIIGIEFHTGPTFHQFFLQQIMLVNCFTLVNAGMMLASQYSRLAYSLVGFHGVHHDTCLPLLGMKAIFFSVVTQSSVGFGSQFPVGCLSMLTTTLQIFLSFIFINQYIYTTLFSNGL
ncbi:hypothetical protein CVIRNUC_003293 [Coccomyxa viridis]|uniref:Uncharacterized protein n=1 Tax=Coccomyxa viridis TaxID=1274662 RepID=A0AAV1I2M2_9CHLO|nr:hypothetical protein CVIRNUC_003293 [Coccomyxa viridis]